MTTYYAAFSSGDTRIPGLDKPPTTLAKAASQIDHGYRIRALEGDSLDRRLNEAELDRLDEILDYGAGR